MSSGVSDTKNKVAYPVAYSLTGEKLIHIRNAPRRQGERYSCAHCGEAMSAVVKVERMAPHFRHTAQPCDADDALHSYGIEVIRQSHTSAKKQGRQYLLRMRCMCRHTILRDCRARCEFRFDYTDLADGWICAVEKSIVVGTRSDIVFSHADGRQIVVELVNTHEMEPETRERYQEAGVWVAIVRLDWEVVQVLFHCIWIDSTFNLWSLGAMCGPCWSAV